MSTAPSHRRRRPGACETLLLLLLASGCGQGPAFDEHQQLQVASQLRFVVQPSDGLTGRALEPTVVVEVLDATGERVRGAELLLHLQLPTRTSGPHLRNAVTFTRDGLGSFPFLALMHSGAYELEAHGPGLATARSHTFTISNALTAPAQQGARR